MTEPSIEQIGQQASAEMEEMMKRATEGLAMVKDLTSMILGSAAGHRSQAVEQGFSETAAEQMAVTYHQILMVKMLNVEQVSS